MSFNAPRCKAFCEKVENALWIFIGMVIFGLWSFSIYKLVEAL
jgi:hypothetical protein